MSTHLVCEIDAEDLLLHGAELHSDNQFSFGRHVLKHISFESPEHVWAEHVVQFLNLVLF